jgi:hypothetical protein
VNYLLLTIAIVLSMLRIGGHTSETYQAAAHLFVGGLFAAGYMQYRYTWTEGGRDAMRKILLAIGLTAVEVACFLWFRFSTSH